MQEKMSRLEFLKKTALGGAVLGLASKGILKDVVTMETVNAATAISVSDNLTTTTVVGAVAPTSTRCTWIDTSAGGTYKYYKDGAWVPIRSTWG